MASGAHEHFRSRFLSVHICLAEESNRLGRRGRAPCTQTCQPSRVWLADRLVIQLAPGMTTKTCPALACPALACLGDTYIAKQRRERDHSTAREMTKRSEEDGPEPQRLGHSAVMAFNLHVQNKTLLIAQEPRKFCSAESNWETKRAAGPPTHLQVHVALENALRTKQFMDKSHRSPDTCKAPIAHILCTGLADSPSRLRPGSGAGSLRPRNLQGIARGSATLK